MTDTLSINILEDFKDAINKKWSKHIFFQKIF